MRATAPDPDLQPLADMGQGTEKKRGAAPGPGSRGCTVAVAQWASSKGSAGRPSIAGRSTDWEDLAHGPGSSPWHAGRDAPAPLVPASRIAGTLANSRPLQKLIRA